jgi:4'-phosphopantetheinyl transferase
LSEEERARLERLVNPAKRAQLSAGLTERRQLLSVLIGCTGRDIEIGHDASGKPCLPLNPDIMISFSDSEGWNALALSRTGPVGIDIERIRPLSWEPMLPMMAGQDEARLIRDTIAGPDDPGAFFRCWTAKEAILKAAGTGLKGGAPRVRLPTDYIRGEVAEFQLEHDGIRLSVETIGRDEIILSRALSY